MDGKPKNIMLKAYDYSVMFYFSRDDFTSVMFYFSRDDFTSCVSSSEMCPLQRIGIWHFEAAIRTIIIITTGRFPDDDFPTGHDIMCNELIVQRLAINLNR